MCSELRDTSGELTDLLHEATNERNSDLVDTVVIVTERRKVALGLVVDNEAVFITDRLDLGVFDGGQRVGRNGETGNTAGDGAQDVCVVQCHLDAFVGVLVMHVVNAVEGIHVGLGKPVHHDVKLSEERRRSRERRLPPPALSGAA